MKIKSFIAIGIIGLLIGLTGCEKDENRVILTDPVKPQLKTVPDLTLLEENEADTLVFVGTPLDPGFTASIIYSLETCETGNNFANKITLFSDIQDERMTVKVGFLNNLLLANYEANTPLSFDFRIKAVLVRDAGTGVNPMEYFSDVVSATVTLYETVLAPINPIYLLGDATEAGWNNNAALEMTHVKDGLFEITATLNETGDWIKFISELGKWAPQWGTDDSGTWEAGPLVYRPTESVPDPKAIPAPHVAGDYLIQADTAKLEYTVTPATAKLFVYGSATDAGLDYSNALPMVKTGVLTFETSVYLKGGDNYSFGFITSQSESSPRYMLSEKGKLTYVSQEANERLIPGPTEEGWYMVKVDLIKRSYSLMKK
ncbi:MAG TPA: SusE domain-containing protein [Tenuifilaceae bacterium]|jgi:hypothetical protein|nr:SusE domain-containing protein [Bacteroidales bacterium]MDI9517023.1 SusE domain-containing protein [Bacteroidota bacterium]NLH55380.1 SusF/SusE family outer membrane protein [Rikenellaceae bacterium]OQC62683.1 MAG: hypothetical protein BWX49_01589 [Bacteroidetes bacterium ADurb.Bin008]HNV81991.1 SusE domain-containing protein [Tenuifilaceae bacterium]